MTVDEIRALINLATETGIAELEVQHGGDRVRIRRSQASEAQYVMPMPAAPPSAPAPSEPPEAGPDPSLITVRSPIVGTFYESSAPGSPPFVRVGERVQPGKVLCIIESMKLMNEIESEVHGVLETKLVQNGQPVEYGEALFAIRSV
jgi:acetyl-CoA carboxylase biotin carboxyl carrier protein